MTKSKYSKIMIFGLPGSGKSTFASILSKKTELPLYHLDKFFYVSNWIERDYDEFLSILSEITSQDKWIIDGNSIKSLEARYSKVDLCLYFNFPKSLCYLRILKRFFYKNPAIDDRAPNCNETIGLAFIKYIWNFEKRVAKQIIQLQEKYPNVKFIEITSEKDLKKFMESLVLI